jgi:hypothetical protein
MAKLTAPRIIAVLIIGFILIWFLILGVNITEVPKIEIRHRTDTSDSYFHDASLKLDFYENHHRRYFIMNYYKLSDTFDLVLNYGDSALNHCPRGSISLSIGHGQTRTHRYSRHCPSCDPAENPAASPVRGSNTPVKSRFPASG